MASTLNLKTPGVYIQEISKFPPSVTAVETAIPAFIGHTEFARKDGEDKIFEPVRISSMLEYQKFFGGPQPEINIVVQIQDTLDLKGEVEDQVITAKFDPGATPPRPRSIHNMFYALQMYFSNGGGPCYVVSVGDYLPYNQQVQIAVGDDDEGFLFALNKLRKYDEPTLIVAPESYHMPLADWGAWVGAVLSECALLQDRFGIFDFHNSGEALSTAGDVLASATVVRGVIPNEVDLTKYGAVYWPYLCSVFNYEYDEATVVIQHRVHPKGAPSTDGNLNGSLLGAVVDKTLVAKAKAAIDNFCIVLPPSAAIAGIYARVDNSRGVWKAPANESLLSNQDLTFKVTDEIQDFLNIDTTAGKSINAIRAFTGRGTLVWGARTLAGNDNEWRYISVRRFFNMVEESVKKATYRFVFEPNDANTWAKVRAMIENFLLLQWRVGALAGAVPEDAFFVKVGLNATMTALDILEGRMIVEIGMAAVRPAEFIILKFSHKMQES